jgi:glucosamine-6-phosphate deaminase
MMPDRCDEIRRLNQMTPDEVIARAGKHLVVYEDLEALHRGFAEDMAQELRARNAAGERTRWIVPVGPVGQYPYFAQIVNRERLSMDNACLLFMDEYVDEYGEVLGWDDPLSFRTLATRWLLNKLDPELMPPPGNIVFPNGDNIDQIAGAIKKAGGVDTCFGGIGIHGHVAFNEPEPGVAKLGPRKVRLNDFTVTINAGMAQILGARRIRLYCRNGCPFDWANTILRVALFGKPGDDYPVTHIRGRDYVIATDRETLSSPRHLI